MKRNGNPKWAYNELVSPLGRINSNDFAFLSHVLRPMQYDDYDDYEYCRPWGNQSIGKRHENHDLSSTKVQLG